VVGGSSIVVDGLAKTAHNCCRSGPCHTYMQPARLQRPLTSVRPHSSSVIPAAAHAAGKVLCCIAVGCALLAHHGTVGLASVGQGRLALHAAEGLGAVHPVTSPATAGAVVCQRGCALTARITLNGVTACADVAHCTLPVHRPQAARQATVCGRVSC
jgi:hypothetical protein